MTDDAKTLADCSADEGFVRHFEQEMLKLKTFREAIEAELKRGLRDSNSPELGSVQNSRSVAASL